MVCLAIIVIKANAQQTADSCLELLNHRKIKSTIEVESQGSVISVGNSDKRPNLPGPAKIDRYTWLFTIDKKEDEYLVKKELSRVEVSASGPVGDIKYDSDNTFESTDDAESMVRSYLPFIKKPYAATFSIKGIFVPSGGKNNKADSLYSISIPVLDTSAFFSGLIFAPNKSLNLADGESWIDSIITTRRVVMTEYTVKKSGDKNITIRFQSSQTFLKQTASQATARNADGSPAALNLNISSVVLSKAHNGEMTVDKATHLITYLTAEITIDLIRSFNGQSSPAKIRSTLAIKNSIN